MGEEQNRAFQRSFNASLKIDFLGSRVASDGGLILVRELDERLGFGQRIEQHLSDPRRGKNTQFPLAGLARINQELTAKVKAIDSPQRVVLDMDWTEIPV